MKKNSPEAEFNEFVPRLKSAKNRFQLSAGLTSKNWLQFKYFKFGLCMNIFLSLTDHLIIMLLTFYSGFNFIIFD